MAGIGFELKKIYRKENLSRNALGLMYSTVVTIGPMVTVILAVFCLYFFMNVSHQPYAERELLSSTIMYGFIFSMLLTSPFNVVFSRYISDKFYMEEYEDILPSYYSGLLCCCGLGSILFWIVGNRLLKVAQLGLAYVILSYIFWISMLIVYFSVSYLNATKDYKRITFSFIFGMLVSFIVAFSIYNFSEWDEKHSILCGMAAGFFFIAVAFFSYIKHYFKKASQNYLESLKYMWEFKTLLFANSFYVLGLYIHNFVFWTAEGNSVVASTFYCHLSYDMASFLAMITNITIMISFTVIVETRFHTVYQEYMESVTAGTYEMITKSRKKMFRNLILQTKQMFRMQIAIVFVIFMVIISFGSKMGISAVTLEIYPILAVAFLGIFMVYANIVYLYYFSDANGAMFTAFIFFIVSWVLSLFARNMDIVFWGIGPFFGMIVAWTYSFFRLRYVERNIDAFVFCDYKVVETIRSNQKGKVVYLNHDKKSK